MKIVVAVKAVATLEALTGGRAFVGIGAGWWEREHAAFGLLNSTPRSARLPDTEMRALLTSMGWAALLAE